MNFSKYRVTEIERLNDLWDYGEKIIKYRRKENPHYSLISFCRSTRTKGLEVEYKNEMHERKIILVIRYDVRSDLFYAEKTINLRGKELESRIIINDADDFYACFDEAVEQHLTNRK